MDYRKQNYRAAKLTAEGRDAEKKGHLKTAFKKFSAALEIWSEMPEEEWHPYAYNYGLATYRYGYILQQAGYYEESVDAFFRSSEITRVPSEDLRQQELFAVSLHALGCMQQAIWRYAEARETYREALPALRKVYELNPPKYEEAIGMIEKNIRRMEAMERARDLNSPDEE